MNQSTFIKLIRMQSRAACVAALAAVFCFSASATSTEKPGKTTVSGTVHGGGEDLAGYRVSLYISYAHKAHHKGHHNRKAGQGVLLGSDTTNPQGKFSIRYKIPHGHHNRKKPVAYLIAEKGKSMLASAIVLHSVKSVVINERTTVATGTAFAQFIAGDTLSGNKWGMYNAVRMAANMANPASGEVGSVLDSLPNADKTRTRATFNSMANIVAACVKDEAHCLELFARATPDGEPAASNVLEALSYMTKYPSNDTNHLFLLSLEHDVYAEALKKPPTSWLLFIKFTGGQYYKYDDSNLMSGPGNIAFDKRGYAWINDNYVPTGELETSCAGLRLMQFYPWGESVPGSPYFGGGLSGAGFGITFDPKGRVWVGNFGFEAPACADGEVHPNPHKKIPATHNSVSLFKTSGKPASGPHGYTEGHIWWPQATVSDPKGNIWVANCGNDTVTKIPRGKHKRAWNIPLPGGQGEQGVYQPPVPGHESPRLKPFGIAIDPQGRAWVTGNKAKENPHDPLESHGKVYRVLPDGTVETMPHLDALSRPVLRWPMGISGDSVGNMWVSNSDAVNVPCVDPLDPQDGDKPSLAYFPADGGYPSRYTGGGLTMPWGNVVDGNDTVWVFNFGRKPTDLVDETTEWKDTGLSHFCGADPDKCPAGFDTGEAISPDTGYLSDALDRITGGGVDVSGNLWLMNNWKKTGPYPPVYNSNPGGNSFVIVPGAAAPVRTPVIGAPTAF